MKCRQSRRFGLESLENRQLLTAVTGYSYDDVGNLTSIVDDSSVAVASRDGDDDLDIYVTNGPGAPAATDATFSLGGIMIRTPARDNPSADGGGVANTHNQLWGDWF